jgi:hypothetical protein
MEDETSGNTIALNDSTASSHFEELLFFQSNLLLSTKQSVEYTQDAKNALSQLCFTVFVERRTYFIELSII